VEEQEALQPMRGDSKNFVFPAVVVTQPVALHYEAKDASDSQPAVSRELRCAPGDILVSAQWMQPGPERREDSLLCVHDGHREWIEGANWNPRAADLVAEGGFRACDWCRPARLQARQLLECAVAARALRLTELGENAVALLSAAYPDSSEAAALRAHDRPIRLAAMRGRLRECVAAGDVRSAVEAARSLLGEDPQGRFGREAGKFMELVNASAADRVARAEKLLAAGDVAGARREVSPITLVVPDDARLAAVLGRCDDLDTLQAGRGALEEGQLRRARLMAEAVLARAPKGVEAEPAQRLLDDVRAAAQARTDRANRFLDQGDAESARDELAPALQAFPDDPAAQAAWTRARQLPKSVAPQK
jgi:tetratricopeptide (TPR) repeat protein